MYFFLSKTQAQNLGRFEYEPKKFFDALTSEQINGTFAVSKQMVDLLKNHPRIKSINWGSIPTGDKLSPKTTQI